MSCYDDIKAGLSIEAAFCGSFVYMTWSSIVEIHASSA